MKLFIHSFIWIIISLILSVYQQNLLELWKNASRASAILAVGILSAPGNFALRDAARSTWLKANFSESTVKSWFIIGNSSCNIPPEYRLSIYGCEKWNVNVSEFNENFFTAYDIPSEPCPSQERIIHQGFSFQVNHGVVVTKLGVLSHVLLENVPIKVAIIDIQTKEIIVQATIPSNNSVSTHGYIYANVDAFLLPKNYEGLLLVEGYWKNTACSYTRWNSGGGIISFKKIFSTPHFLDSRQYSPTISVAASIGFFIPDLNKLKKIINEENSVTSRWLSHLEDTNARLKAEIADKRDILVVDVIDTYRSLPAKLLKFYEWLHFNYKYSYVLKTDDDCVVNIPQLLERLLIDTKFNPARIWLWSRFRKEWPLNYIGKWADNDYRSLYYPAFPCGAAYVMSYTTSLWLSSNSENLYPYQGEDVSIGIWLAAINPDYIDDDTFECDKDCTIRSYNRAQLSLSEIYEVWSNFKKCNNLCSCGNES